MISESRKFIEEINEAGSEDVIIRVNSNGGEVRYGYGMIARISELTGKVTLKNDGDASSMAALMFCYVNDSEALDVSTFTFHRAAYPDWIESNPEYFTEADKVDLARMNKNLRAALEGKIDVEKFAAITKVSIDDLFSMDGRIDVTISAKDAKKIGLINRIITITPQKEAEINAKKLEITALRSGLKIAAKSEDKNINLNTMKKDEIKSTYPAAYAEIVKEAQDAAIEAERDRVGAALTFVDVDPEAVKEIIKTGKAMTQTQMTELTVKKVSALSAKKVEEENAGTTKTSEESEEIKAKTETKAFMAEVNELLKDKIS